MAYLAGVVLPRLRLHPARRQSPGKVQVVDQSDDRLGPHRGVARRSMELRFMGFVLRSAPYRREAVASQANGEASRRAAAPLRDRRVHVRLAHLLDRGSCGVRRIPARFGRGFRRHGNLDRLGAQRVGVLAGAPDMRRRQHPRPSLAACEGRRMGERSKRARVSGGRSARGEAPFRGRALRHPGMVRRLAFRRAQIRKARRAFKACFQGICRTLSARR